MNPKLCFIKDNFAFFTTQELDKQWGCDWNDSPWYYNASDPYEPCWHRKNGDCECELCKRDWNADGTPKWEIIKIAWESNDYTSNDIDVSAEEINKKIYPWLKSIYNDDDDVYAGISLDEFVEKIQSSNGVIYYPVKYCSCKNCD